MGDDITIGVTEIVNNIEVTAQPNDQIIDISVVDNADDVTLNITPTVIEINVNKGSSYAKWGTILGTLSDQEDLQDALDLKADLVDGKVPSSQLPSYVDDVIEVANYAALPTVGESGKIYITLDDNHIFRWTGSTYVEITDNTAVWGAITGTLSSQTDLQSALNLKANDNAVVHLTGNENISGTKTFGNTIYANGGTGEGEYAIEIDKSFEGEAIRVKNASSTTFTLGLNGAVTALRYVKSGGTSSQFLKADGSVDSSTYQPLLTNPITGTGTTNYVPKFTGTSALGNSLIYDNGTNVFVGGSGSNGNRFTVVEGGTTLVGQQILMQNASSANDALNIVHSGTGKLIKGTKGVEVFNITNSGGAYFADNVGIGVTPSAWDTVWKVLQISKGSYYASDYSNIMAHNLYVAGEDTKYISTNRASQYEQNGGSHYWYTAPVGTAGANMTLSPRMTLDNDGKLGIGITTPNAKLHISNSGAQGIEFEATGGALGGGYIQSYNRSTSVFSNLDLYANTIAFQTGSGSTSAERMRITSGGNVGIGNGFTPAASLHVEVNTSTWTSRIVNLNTSTNNAGLLIKAGVNSGNEILKCEKANGTIVFLADASGNVGVGTATPTEKLQIDGSVRIAGQAQNFSAGSAGLNIDRIDASGLIRIYGVSGSAGIIGDLALGTSNTERMRITSGGNIGIGTQTITGLQRGLALNDSSNCGIILKNNDVNKGYLYNSGNNIYLETTGGTLYAIASTGGVYISSGATSWTSNSDNRLKDINYTIENAVEKLCTLNAVSFSWKSDESKKEVLGLIAQDVEKVFPQVIDKNKLSRNVGDESEIDDTEYLGVRYQELIPVLVKAIQELKAEIELLKAK